MFLRRAPQCRIQLAQCSHTWLERSRSSVCQHSVQRLKLSNYLLVVVKLEFREKERFNNLLA